jgi:hypothetical protein
MRTHLILVVPLVLASMASPAPTEERKTTTVTTANAVPDTTADDQKMLRDLRLGVDGPALLDYFKKRTYPEANPTEMATLIRDLGNDEFTMRERAYERLLVLGAGALVGIKEAGKSKDAEVSRRADELRQHIEAKADPGIQAATARLIANTKPAGAAEILLNYIPFAADQVVTDEICKALASVAVVGGKVEPSVAQALTDKIPIKRAAAGEALAGARVQEQLPGVRKLLGDADPSVRLRVALALLPLKERQALPVLVDSLGHLNPEQLWRAEEILVRLAGERAPAVSLGTTDAARQACRAAWQAWFDREGKTINLAKLDEAQTMLGYTLIVQQNNNRVALQRRNMGEVMEVDAAKKPRWKFDIATYPVEAQIVRVDGAERVLVAEFNGGRVSERDFKGEVKWEKAVGGNPIGVQRLGGGNTFVVMQNRLSEIDRKGNEVFTLNRPNHDIFRARKLRNGDVVFVTQSGILTRIDGKSQKVLKTFNVGQFHVLFGSIDVLPDGGVLVPNFQQGVVAEYNNDGKQVKTFNVQSPNAVMRLPNGNTLVTSQITRLVIEFDRTGRQVWNYMAEGMPVNARRR